MEVVTNQGNVQTSEHQKFTYLACVLGSILANIWDFKTCSVARLKNAHVIAIAFWNEYNYGEFLLGELPVYNKRIPACMEEAAVS